jgi:hypothetical protein
MERLEELGHFTPPTLSQLEDALDGCLPLKSAVVTADLWDAQRLSACEHCKSERIDRLRVVSLTGVGRERIACDRCHR